MSGGAFNYLCFKDTQILNHLHDLESLEKHCRELGLHDEADEVYEFLLFCQTTKRRVATYTNRMSDLLQAVEWQASGDSGIERIKNAYQDLMKGKAE